MNKEERRDDLYNLLPWYVRAIIRTIVVLMDPLNRLLDKYEMGATFYIDDFAEYGVIEIEDEPDEEILH